MGSGELYAVDPVTGEASMIDLGGVPVNGDGLVRTPRTWIISQCTSQQTRHARKYATIPLNLVYRAPRFVWRDWPGFGTMTSSR